MIYVHRDWSRVPQKKLDQLKTLSEELEKLEGKEAKKAFIKANSAAWSEVRGELQAMSFDKCWYTEAKETVSRYQTDHFRPHGRVKQADKAFAEGYSWLAFDVVNYRIIGLLANTQNQEYSKETVGKGIWFPLADPTKRATLADRELSKETPLLLDPTELEDPDKIEFNANGEAHPAAHLDAEASKAVDLAIVRMGIRQDMLNGARRKKWRECERAIHKYTRVVRKPKGNRTPEETETMAELVEELVTMAMAESVFSATVRSCLTQNRLAMLILRNELDPLKIV